MRSSFILLIALLAGCFNPAAERAPQKMREAVWTPVNIERAGAKTFANLSFQSPDLAWVEVLADYETTQEPGRDNFQPGFRSSISTWLVDCQKEIGALNAVTWYEANMGVKRLGKTDMFASPEHFKRSSEVSELCKYLKDGKPLPQYE